MITTLNITPWKTIRCKKLDAETAYVLVFNPGSSFFPGCVLLSAKQTDHPLRGPSCPKTGWERTNTQENSQALIHSVWGDFIKPWSCQRKLWVSPSRNGNLEMKHKNDCGEAWQTYCLWYHPFNCTGQNVGASLWTQAQWQTSIKTDRTKLSAVPLWIPNMSSWCTSWCPFGKDQSKKKSMGRYPNDGPGSFTPMATPWHYQWPFQGPSHGELLLIQPDFSAPGSATPSYQSSTRDPMARETGGTFGA